jgi:ribosomal protein S27AE
MSIEKNISRIFEEIEKSEKLISESIILSESSTFSPPLNKLRVSSPFGPRWGSHHDGVDLDAVDEPVKSLADGVVITTHADKYPCGGTIMIKHSDGYTTGFCHMQKINVQVGQEVKKGDVIGISGGGEGDPGKGRSTGKHLHLTIRKDGKPLDPMDYIDKEGVLVGTVPLSPTSGTDIATIPTSSSDSQGTVPEFGIADFDFLTGNVKGNIADFDFIKGIKERKITENIKRIKNLL